MFRKMNRGYYQANPDEMSGASGSAESGAEDTPSDTANVDAAADADKKAKAPESKAAESDKKAASETSASEMALLKESMKRKEIIKKQQEELDAAKKALAAYGDIEPEKVQSLLKVEEEREQKSLEQKGDYEAVKKRMAESHKAEIDKIVKENQSKFEDMSGKIASYEAKIEKLTIGNAFDSSRYISEELTLPNSKAKTVYANHFDVDDSGRVVGYDRPRGQEGRTPFVDGNGDPFAFEDAMKALIQSDPDRDMLVRSKVKKGSDSDTKAKLRAKQQEASLTGIERIKASISQLGVPVSDKGVDLSK